MRQRGTTLLRRLHVGRLLVLCAAGAISAAGPAAFRVVYNLQGYDQPAGIIEGSPGVFYSIAGSGPSIAFSVTSQGRQTVLGTIPKGNLFQSLLVSGPNGRFYTSVYSGTPNATNNVFSVSSAPNSARTYPTTSVVPELTQGLPGGRLLAGALDLSPGAAGWGVATADMEGSVTMITTFPSSDQTENVIYGSDGNFYGVVEPANSSTTGYVFRLSPSGSLTKLYNFPANTFTGYMPTPLLQADDGNLYGATVTGGANGTGMIYKLTLGGQFTLLHSFGKGQIPQGPASLIEASDGNLYGVSQANSGAGQIFRLTKSGGYAVLYEMTEANGLPPCWLLQGSDGVIYGVAHAGGQTGAGTVFALDVGLKPPKPTAQHFQPESGAVGTEVLIWGYNLLSPSVSFNGAATTKVFNSGSNYILATVPAGASTGPITITTPGGTHTTRASFTVQ